MERQSLSDKEIMAILLQLKQEIDKQPTEMQEEYKENCQSLCQIGCNEDLLCIKTQCQELCSIKPVEADHSSPLETQALLT